REAVQRRPLAEDPIELGWIRAGDPAGVEVAEPLAQVERPRERLLDGDLLVEREADEQGKRVGSDQRVGLVVAGERESRGHLGRHLRSGRESYRAAPAAPALQR